MSKINRQIENHRLKLSTIVERLPMYRFLDQSQALMLKLQPAWHAWLNKHLPNVSDQNTCLLSLDAGSLTIGVNNSSTGSLIKHKQVSLLSTLNSAFNQLEGKSGSKHKLIEKLVLRVDLESTSIAADVKQRTIASDDPREAPNTNSIESIQHLQKNVSNPDLAATLGALAETLKRLSRT